MKGYVKIYGSILGSSVWAETPNTRIVWITMLALADQHGHVEASVSGLARFANVGIEECRVALAALSAPDTDSKSKEWDGRRVEAIEGGWAILNYLKYREMRSPKQVEDAERKQRWRDQERERDMSQMSTEVAPTVAVSESVDETEATTTTRALRVSWLTPIAVVYEQRMGAGSFPFSKAGKLLKPLIDAQHSGEEVAVRLGRYIDGLDDVKYLSLAKFRETFGNYTTAGRNGKVNPGLQQMANILGGDRD